jgi:hypothetical protein
VSGTATESTNFFKVLNISQQPKTIDRSPIYIYIFYVCRHTISSTKTKSIAMCGNNIHRVKFVIDDKIIEQVTEFIYLFYCISEYKSDLEDKLQTYNKINGAIRRYFGKQMTKETKLRIHNMTAKPALKYGSEFWVLKKTDEQRLESAQMKYSGHWKLQN